MYVHMYVIKNVYLNEIFIELDSKDIFYFCYQNQQPTRKITRFYKKTILKTTI